jgi:hypothetical protein
MAFPSTIDTFAGTTAQGTSLLTAPDHSLDHRTLGSATYGIEGNLGTNSGTSVLKNFTSGDFAARVNNESFGSPTITGGTANNQILGSPSVTGGTLSAPLINTHSIGSSAYSGTASGTTTLDLGTASRHLVTMPNSAGAVTLALSNVVANRPFMVEILQGTAGSGTITWFSTIKWVGSAAPTQTLTASRKDTFGFIPTSGTTFDGYIVGQNI